MGEVGRKDRSNPFLAEEEPGCRNEQQEAPYDIRMDHKRGTLLRYLDSSLERFFRKWNNLNFIALHYILRIQFEDLAIGFQKRSGIDASGQIGKPAFLETLEVAQTDPCFRCYLG
jgi:hypothetical protein